MTTGDNNLTGDSIENMTAGAAAAEMDQTGSISSAEEGDPIPDIDVKLGKCPKCPNGYPKPK